MDAPQVSRDVVSRVIQDAIIRTHEGRGEDYLSAPFCVHTFEFRTSHTLSALGEYLSTNAQNRVDHEVDVRHLRAMIYIRETNSETAVDHCA